MEDYRVPAAGLVEGDPSDGCKLNTDLHGFVDVIFDMPLNKVAMAIFSPK